MHDYLTGGFTGNTSLAHYCRDNGLLLHIYRAMHAVIDRQKNHGKAAWIQNKHRRINQNLKKQAQSDALAQRAELGQKD